MQIFHTPLHELHAPTVYMADGTLRRCPERPARAEAILHAVRALPGVKLSLPGAADPMPAITAIHDRRYIQYLRTIHAAWQAEFGTGDVIPDTFPARRCSSTIPEKPSAQAGYFCFDMAAPITAGTYEAAVGSAACAVAAAEAMAGGQRAVYALCRPPGHHAGQDYCGGFCYFNNVAVAAKHLLLHRNGPKRLAILDVDYHHGNGTQDIFWTSEDVLFVSIHADPHTQYPYFWGHAVEEGTGPGAGSTLNLPLVRGASEAQWFSALEKAIGRIEKFAPAMLLVSLGVDTHELDGVGDFHLTERSFSRVGRRLRAMGLPTCFVQEGGYNLAAAGPSVAAVLGGFEGF